MINFLQEERISKECFMYKLFIIFFLYDFEKYEIKDMSFILDEKEEVILTYHRLCKEKSTLDKSKLGDTYEKD